MSDDGGDDSDDTSPDTAVNSVSANRANASTVYIHTRMNTGSSVGFTGKGKIRLRKKGSSTEVFELPTGAWIPATRTSLPIARTNFANTNIKQNDTIHSDKPSLLSEKEGFRLLQVYMKYRDRKGEVRVGRVQIDTQS